MLTSSTFLPPASEGMGKVLFPVFLSVHTSMGGGGATLARSGWWGGGYPGQVWMVGRGVPQPGLDGGGTQGTPMTGWGTRLARSGWWGGYPGYPPTMTGWSTPPPSIASTCYAAGGMPLAFTQEDFLV